ncbi:MAG: serine hydrolase [Clostridia bacterium]|nr:serine hydrolase [Clostridia bacterium]
MRRFTLALILAAAMLASCTGTAGIPPEPLDAAVTASPGAAESAVSEPPETAAETTSAPEPPLPLPETVETNIEDNAARAILAEIADVVSAYWEASVSFIDTAEGWYYTINGGLSYPSASTIKALYCQYLLEAGADFSAELILTESKRTSSTGLLDEEDVGSVFTVGELMGYAICDSDNMAYRLLYEKYGYRKYNEWVRGLGLENAAMGGYEFCDVTARDLSLGMLRIYRWSVEQEDERLVSLLCGTSWNMQIPLGTTHTVAHKYGYQGGTDGYHDTAIVFADVPYVLTVMTHNWLYSKDANDIFFEVTLLTDELQELLYSGEGKV